MICDRAVLPQNKALLVKVLEYHVIAGKTIQASQITDGLEAKTLEGPSKHASVHGLTPDGATV